MRKSPRKIESFLGETFNFLTLIELAEPQFFLTKKGMTKRSMWKCKCICGKEKIISHGNIVSGNIKSCGCQKKKITIECIKRYYEKTYLTPVEGKLISRYKTDAKLSNREFSLTSEHFSKLVNSNCHYCGLEPFLIRGNKTNSVRKALNGVDRIDSNKGYTEDNVVPCCPNCNRAKMARSYEDFKEWIKLVYNNLFNNKY